MDRFEEKTFIVVGGADVEESDNLSGDVLKFQIDLVGLGELDESEIETTLLVLHVGVLDEREEVVEGLEENADVLGEVKHFGNFLLQADFLAKLRLLLELLLGECISLLVEWRRFEEWLSFTLLVEL